MTRNIQDNSETPFIEPESGELLKTKNIRGTFSCLFFFFFIDLSIKREKGRSGEEGRKRESRREGRKGGEQVGGKKRGKGEGNGRNRASLSGLL